VLRAECGSYAKKVFLGGLIGCKGDSYRPEESLSREEAEAFHQEQLRALAGAGVDFLCAATLPAAAEAYGIAHAMSKTSMPYVLSFVLSADGTLLDGTPLHKVIADIDGTALRPPAFYMINCVHPSIFRRAYTLETMAAQKLTQRISGLQANTSPRSPRELDGLPVLETEDPGHLADTMIRLHTDFGLRILGGCCGTDDRHIARLAERAAALSAPLA
jgi:homocysteine S-methyltransferase